MGPGLTSWIRRVVRWLGTHSAGEAMIRSVTSPHPEAERIIVARDNLNALLYELHDGKIFLVHEERGLLQLFKHCRTEEDFRFRVIALAGLAGTLNEQLLRKVTGSGRDGSINLLQDFLVHAAPHANHSGEIQVLRDLVSVRNMFPAHRDNAGQAMAACNRLGLGYPIVDYGGAWTSLLGQYAGALEGLLEIVKALPMKK